MTYIRKTTPLSEAAIKWLKENKKALLHKFANDEICAPTKEPVTMLMAGGPGAGKTEFSRNLILKKNIAAVRIDPDDIKIILPQYNGANSDEVQGAAAIGVEKLYDYVLEKKKSVIVDGTFQNYDVSAKNIKRSLDKGRPVTIFYVYQDPLVAWEFTQIREKKEGRHIPKKAFVDAFFKAKANVEKASKEFEGRIRIHIFEKDYKNNTEILHTDVKKNDNIIKIGYNEKTLLRKLS